MNYKGGMNTSCQSESMALDILLTSAPKSLYIKRISMFAQLGRIQIEGKQQAPYATKEKSQSREADLG